MLHKGSFSFLTARHHEEPCHRQDIQQTCLYDMSCIATDISLALLAV